MPVITLAPNDEDAPAGEGLRRGILLARLVPGLSLDQASAEARAIIARIRPSQMGEVDVWTLHQPMVRGIRRALIIMLGAVGFMLLIVWANVANLVLARGTRRRQEVTIRAALGASRSALVRRVLVETGLLGLAGGLLGGLARKLGHRGGPELRCRARSPIGQVTLDARIVVVAMGVSLLSGLLVGCVPALRVLVGAPESGA